MIKLIIVLSEIILQKYTDYNHTIEIFKYQINRNIWIIYKLYINEFVILRRVVLNTINSTILIFVN